MGILDNVLVGIIAAITHREEEHVGTNGDGAKLARLQAEREKYEEQWLKEQERRGRPVGSK